jgi:repressor LexA
VGGVVDQLSPRQSDILDFIKGYIDQSGVVPSFREIGKAVGIQSTNGVSDHIRALERKGYIERGGRGSPRSFRLTTEAVGFYEKENVVGVPLLGRIAAGQPLLAEENYESTLRFDSALLPPGGDVFALMVTGDSMIDDGIHSGDYLFVRKNKSFKNGQIGVVLVDGDATVKRLYHEGDRLRLQPANSNMDDFYVDATAGEVEMIGVAVGVFRRIHH